MESTAVTEGSCKCEISWSLWVARLNVKTTVSLWNLTGDSATLLPSRLSNFIVILHIDHTPSIRSYRVWKPVQSIGDIGCNWVQKTLFREQLILRLTKLINNRYLNTLRPRPNDRLFPDDIFKWVFLNKNVWISIEISLKFVPKGPINDIPSLVQIMAWRRSGDKPLSEPMMVRLPTHVCVTRPQWVKHAIRYRKHCSEINWYHT